jgi:D-alanyl-D-alanine dipeptidase
MSLTAMVLGAILGAATPATVQARIASVPDLVDAGTVVAELQVELVYATPDNFMKEPIYGDLRACFLHRDAAAMLARAQVELRKSHPELRLRVYDCARPQFVQERMWGIVKGTPQEPYVADPAKRSIHNFGCAVDVTVATREGKPLDMGTAHDHFGDLARVDKEKRFLAEGKLTKDQIANRSVLRDAMTKAGWRVLETEWWHFDCAAQSETRRRFRPIP